MVDMDVFISFRFALDSDGIIIRCMQDFGERLRRFEVNKSRHTAVLNSKEI
jgi:hypothetical protein